MAIEQIKTQAKKIQEEATTSAHRVYLAGLGAAAVAEEQGAKLVAEGGKLIARGEQVFDQLVARGRKVETAGKKRLDKGKKQVAEVRKKGEQVVSRLQGELDGQVAKVTQRLGIPHQEQIRVLSDRVAELTRKIDSLQKTAKAQAAG